jgi:hypothetical protein
MIQLGKLALTERFGQGEENHFGRPGCTLIELMEKIACFD